MVTFLSENPGLRGRCTRDRKAIDQVPNTGLVYDYKIDPQKGKWKPWIKGGGGSVPDGVTSFTDIVVDTIDTIRNEFLVKLLLQNQKHVLLNGETGTGKSVATKKLLTEVLPSNVYMPIFISFSAQTSANQTQDIIDREAWETSKGCIWSSTWSYCNSFC